MRQYMAKLVGSDSPHRRGKARILRTAYKPSRTLRMLNMQVYCFADRVARAILSMSGANPQRDRSKGDRGRYRSVAHEY